MRLSLAVPALHPLADRAAVTALAAVGTRLAAGDPVCDLVVTLTDDVAHDCPAATPWRLVAREPAWVLSAAAAPGDVLPVGAPLLELGDAPDAPAEAPARALRVSPVVHVPAFSWDDAFGGDGG